MKSRITLLAIFSVATLCTLGCGDDAKTERRDQEPRVAFGIQSEAECARQDANYHWVENRCVYDPSKGNGRKL